MDVVSVTPGAGDGGVTWWNSAGAQVRFGRQGAGTALRQVGVVRALQTMAAAVLLTVASSNFVSVTFRGERMASHSLLVSLCHLENQLR